MIFFLIIFLQDLKDEVMSLRFHLHRVMARKQHYKEKWLNEKRNVDKLLEQRGRLEYKISIYKDRLATSKGERKVPLVKNAKLGSVCFTLLLFDRFFFWVVDFEIEASKIFLFG